MARTKTSSKSIEIRLSVNLTLDDVGLEHMYHELYAIETGAAEQGLNPAGANALKRRHLLKILHGYCNAGFRKEVLPNAAVTPTSNVEQKSSITATSKDPKTQLAASEPSRLIAPVISKKADEPKKMRKTRWRKLHASTTQYFLTSD